MSDTSGLLDAGRAAFSSSSRYGRIGLSASSRSSLEDFYNNATTLFNSLYSTAQDQQTYNTTAILALRSKYSYLATSDLKSTIDTKNNTKAGITDYSKTTGTKVNTTA